jgi:hypothetical protein
MLLGAAKRGRKAECGNTRSRAGRTAAAPAPNPMSGSGTMGLRKESREVAQCAGSNPPRE